MAFGFVVDCCLGSESSDPGGEGHFFCDSVVEVEVLFRFLKVRECHHESCDADTACDDDVLVCVLSEREARPDATDCKYIPNFGLLVEVLGATSAGWI